MQRLKKCINIRKVLISNIFSCRKSMRFFSAHILKLCVFPQKCAWKTQNADQKLSLHVIICRIHEYNITKFKSSFKSKLFLQFGCFKHHKKQNNCTCILLLFDYIYYLYNYDCSDKFNAYKSSCMIIIVQSPQIYIDCEIHKITNSPYKTTWGMHLYDTDI